MKTLQIKNLSNGSFGLPIFTMMLFIMVFAFMDVQGQVSINADGTDPDESAMLDVQSTTKGMLVPRMTSTQRTGISNPATGLLVFDTETESFWFYNGTAWQELGMDDLGNHTATQNLQLGTNYLSGDGDSEGIVVDSDGNVGIGTNNPSSIFHVVTSQTGNVSRLHNPTMADGSLIGYEFGKEFTSNNLAEIRYNHVSDGNAANWINIGIQGKANTLNITGAGNVGIGTTAAAEKLEVAGKIRMVDGNQQAGYVMTSDANGTASWQSVSDDQTLILNGSTLSIENGNSVDLSPINTDDQAISLNSNTLSLEDGGSVDLGGYLDNTDNQAISLNSNTLSLEDGGSVDLSTYLDNTDNQDLSLTGNTLSLTGDASDVDLNAYLDNTDDQAISLNSNILSLEDGGSVDLSPYLDADNMGNHTATQNIQLNGNWISRDSDSEGISIDNNGKATIKSNLNSTSPNVVLELQASYRPHIEFLENGVNNWQIGGGSGSFTFRDRANGTTPFAIESGSPNNLLYVDNTGRVGIGISSPGAKLDVDGRIRMRDGNQATGYVAVSDADGSMTWTDPTTISDGKWIIAGNDVYTAVSGNVGIGTTTAPQDKLHVIGNTRIDGTLKINNVYELPTVDGALRQVLTTNGSGVVSWMDPDYQTLSLNANTLTLTYGGDIDLSPYLDADDLGNHTATQTIQTNGNWLSNDGDNEGIFVTDQGQAGISTLNNELPWFQFQVLGTTNRWRIGQNSNNDFIFQEEQGGVLTDKMIIEKDGDVGIGITNASARLHIKDDFAAAGQFTAIIENTNGGGFANGLKIQAGQNTQTVNNRFISFARPDGQEIGAVRQITSNSVDYNTTSDIRLKTNITPTTKGLNDLMQIEVKDYLYKDDPAHPQTGFIAQQVYEHYPNAVTPGGDDVKTDPWMMDYGKMTPLLVKAVQEQQAQIEDLKAENEALQNKVYEVDALKAQNAEMKAEIESIKTILEMNNNIVKNQ